LSVILIRPASTLACTAIAILCINDRFHEIYEHFVRRKVKVTMSSLFLLINFGLPDSCLSVEKILIFQSWKSPMLQLKRQGGWTSSYYTTSGTDKR